MATRRERAEKAEYDRLHAIYGKTTTGKAAVSRAARKAADQDDDSPVIMLSGKRADSFLSWMFGESSPAKPADDEDQADDEDEDEEDDEDDDEEDEQDPPTERQGHRFFASRTRG